MNEYAAVNFNILKQQLMNPRHNFKLFNWIPIFIFGIKLYSCEWYKMKILIHTSAYN